MKNKGVILFLLISCGCVFAAKALSLPTDCPPVTIPNGIDILCEMSDTGDDKKECPTSPMNYNGSFPKGTILRYTCRSKSADVNARELEHWSLKNFLLCKCQGNWKGLKEFKEYVADCDSGKVESSTKVGQSKVRKVVKVVVVQPNRPNINKTVPAPEESSVGENKGNPVLTVSSVTAPEYQRVALGYHNLYRRLHRSPTLKLNQTLTKIAQDWADHEVTQDILEDMPGKRTNVDNIFEVIGANMTKEKAMKLAMESWYGSVADYNWDKPRASPFSQIIWKSTTDIGVGVASLGEKTVVVCAYWPPGNMYILSDDESEKNSYFKSNVLPFSTGMVFLTRSGSSIGTVSQ